MARYVVLSFEDNDEAEEFSRSQIAYLPDGSAFDDPTVANTAQVVGLYAQPTTFHEQQHTPEEYAEARRSRVSGNEVRGERFGWLICTVCLKPRMGIRDPETVMKFTIGRMARNLMNDRPQGESIDG